jgi:hypothetical protein
LFTGGYASYLSSTASMQLQAEGATDLATTDLSAWTLAPGALEVTFPGGTVSYPLSSLSHYIRHPGPLSP